MQKLWFQRPQCGNCQVWAGISGASAWVSVSAPPDLPARAGTRASLLKRLLWALRPGETRRVSELRPERGRARSASTDAGRHLRAPGPPCRGFGDGGDKGEVCGALPGPPQSSPGLWKKVAIAIDLSGGHPAMPSPWEGGAAPLLWQIVSVPTTLPGWFNLQSGYHRLSLSS